MGARAPAPAPLAQHGTALRLDNQSPVAVVDALLQLAESSGPDTSIALTREQAAA